MTNLTVFAFEGQQVRFVGTTEQPEWVAQDVCKCLELSDTSKALEPLEVDEKGTKIIRTPGGEQEMLTVTEPGLYRLLFKSRKPIAKRFQRWIFHEVIPSIRQTGSYSLPQAETERMRLELDLIRAKQHYQDTSYAIVLSTSPAVLEWLRGETPRPKELVYRDRFLNANGHEVGSSSGRSLTQLIADAGLNPKSTKDRQTIKKILKCNGFDYDRRQGWSSASYLREHPVLEDDAYSLALKAVLGEVLAAEQAPNLFIHSLQQKAISTGKSTQRIEEVEP